MILGKCLYLARWLKAGIIWKLSTLLEIPIMDDTVRIILENAAKEGTERLLEAIADNDVIPHFRDLWRTALDADWLIEDDY